jgi:hypothetical protein
MIIVLAEGSLRTHRPMVPGADPACERRKFVNGDLARSDDSQGTLLDVVDIFCFSSPLESAFGKGRAIESGFSGSQL